MSWNVKFYPDFEKEAVKYSAEVRLELAAYIKLLAEFGYELGRPHADTLKNSKHKNMKELRFKADNGVWRVAYAFDTDRNAILLIAGDKSGISERLFYTKLIKKADERFGHHLAELKK